MRKLDVPVSRNLAFDDLHYLLKEGNLHEFTLQKEKRIKEWKENRYRICVECGKEKLRTMFIGQSKYCTYCKTHRKKDSLKRRREYLKIYKDTNVGKQVHCAKQVVYYLKKCGLLAPTDCESCSNKTVQAHHKDYNKPWEVNWLCKKCHNEWHKSNKPIYIK